jgi:superfamily I DNA/RNA helicase/RecB family exonuclease
VAPAPFEPDPSQREVIAHRRGSLLVVGTAGTGKTAVLRERFARLIEEGADPERIALVVGSRRARREARTELLLRLNRPLPELKVATAHALAFHVMSRRHDALGYPEPPRVLTAADQFAKVRELLLGEDPAEWPAYGTLLGVRGFADQVRQFLSRAQEALVSPDEITVAAERAGLTGWRELAAFYQRYLDVLGAERAVDFAGLVAEAARAAERTDPLFDHLLVDDYQDTTLGAEALIANLNVDALVVVGDLGSHVFSFQGTTDLPLARFEERFANTSRIELPTDHRSGELERRAWFVTHTSDEHAAAARELRRIHVEEGVPWGEMAIVVRRQGSHLNGVLRALEDARIPRTVPEIGLSLPLEPAIHPFVLALRWLARPEERPALIEPILTSALVGISPADARGAVRGAQAGGNVAEALASPAGLDPDETALVREVHAALRRAAAVADGSVLDAFSVLWRELPYSRLLVRDASRRDLDAVVEFAEAVERVGSSADPSVQAFVAALEPGVVGPGFVADDEDAEGAVHVLTAHATAGREFDTVIVVGTTEGDFPSLARPEPMFDLATLERSVPRSERNRLRLEDERRLFRMVASRARRRVLLTASDSHGESSALTARSRFVDELGLPWTSIPTTSIDQPVSVREAEVTWRRALADTGASPPVRVLALEGLLAIGADPLRWWFQREWSGTDRPLHEHIRVSASRLETLENCGLQFILREELALGRPSGYQAWVGKLVHRIIEDCENQILPRRLEALLAAADERWSPREFPSLAVSEAFRALVKERMLPNWFQEYADKPALATEQRFEFEYDDATVVGYIDRIGEIVSGGHRITDFKTGKPDNAPRAEDSLQLGIYYLASEEAEALAGFRPVRRVELAFLKGHWRTGELDVRAWQGDSRSEEAYKAHMRERLSGLISRLRELNQTEAYRPSTQAKCWGCEFKTLCPLWPEGRELFPLEVSA